MGSATRSITTLLVGAGALFLGYGLLVTLIPIRAQLESFSTLWIGLMGTANFAGFAIGCVIGPRAVKSVGHVRCFAGFAALLAATVLIHPLAVDPLAWSVLARADRTQPRGALHGGGELAQRSGEQPGARPGAVDLHHRHQRGDHGRAALGQSLRPVGASALHPDGDGDVPLPGAHCLDRRTGTAADRQRQAAHHRAVPALADRLPRLYCDRRDRRRLLDPGSGLRPDAGVRRLPGQPLHGRLPGRRHDLPVAPGPPVGPPGPPHRDRVLLPGHRGDRPGARLLRARRPDRRVRFGLPARRLHDPALRPAAGPRQRLCAGRGPGRNLERPPAALRHGRGRRTARLRRRHGSDRSRAACSCSWPRSSACWRST